MEEDPQRKENPRSSLFLVLKRSTIGVRVTWCVHTPLSCSVHITREAIEQAPGMAAAVAELEYDEE
jgi:hypothetical protein